MSDNRSVYLEMTVAQFKGKPPEIPLNGVDMDSLTAGDSEPFFVTLPAFEVGRPSANKRLITREQAESIISQVNIDKPYGIMGHIRNEDRATRFDAPAVYWLGGQILDNVAWVKGYVPPGQVREMLRTMKAANAKIALSIYGTATHTWDSQAGANVLSEMDLESIDLAPPKRSGFGLDAVPHITAEMIDPDSEGDSSDNHQDMGENESMTTQITAETRHTVISEMTPHDAPSIPDSVKLAIVQKSEVIAEMRDTLGISGNGDVLQAVKDLVSRLATIEGETVKQAVIAEIAKHVMPDATVKPDDEQDPVNALRATVAEMALAASPTQESVSKVVSDVLERPNIKAMMSAITVAEMGPKLTTAPGPNGGKSGNKFFEIPESDG